MQTLPRWWFWSYKKPEYSTRSSTVISSLLLLAPSWTEAHLFICFAIISPFRFLMFWVLHLVCLFCEFSYYFALRPLHNLPFIFLIFFVVKLVCVESCLQMEGGLCIQRHFSLRPKHLHFLSDKTRNVLILMSCEHIEEGTSALLIVWTFCLLFARNNTWEAIKLTHVAFQFWMTSLPSLTVCFRIKTLEAQSLNATSSKISPQLSESG